MEVNKEQNPLPDTEEKAAATESERTEEPAAQTNGVVVQTEKVLTKSQQRKRSVLRWIIITLGSICMAVSVYFFQAPNNFLLGGVGGISIILANAQKVLTQAQLMAIINVGLLIIGFAILGKRCTVRTIVCSLIYTGLIYLFELLIPLDKPVTAKWLTDEAGQFILNAEGMKMTDGGQPFLELVYAILLFGVGGALIFNCGASSGGTDIIALIVKKFTKLNVGVALTIVDLTVVIASVFTNIDLTTVLYSLLGLFTKMFLLDGVIESLGKTKCLTVITTKHKDIGDYILKTIDHSYTLYDAQGGYTGRAEKVLVTVCKRSEALKIKTKVKQIDESAFVIITDANEILGKGFGGTF